MVSEVISEEEKRQALERVVASRTFGRSDQLRGFLRYICESEFEGRAHELNEYVLGVSVLGRPADYSPTEDSCVRTRAYELRNKLKSYYALEAPEDPVHIEIRKGAYIPQFRRPAAEAAETDGAVAPAPRVAPLVLLAPASVVKARGWYFAAAVAVLTGVVLSIFYPRQRSANVSDAPNWTPEMTAFWKPFLNSRIPVIVSFEIRLFFNSQSTGLVVRDVESNQLSDLAGSKPLTRFRLRMGAGELQETADYADFGAVHAAFLLGRLLGSQHQEIGLKHSASLGWEDLRNNNVIFIGKPNLNPTIRYALRTPDFADNELGYIRNLHPLPGEPAEYRSASTHGAGVKYALITLLPAPQSGHHIMILSGAGAEFLWALGESVTDPARVQELVSHLRLPSGELPAAFQAVIEATFESNVPIKVRYVTHRVSKRP